MYAPVGHERLERATRHFAPVRVERGKHHRVRRVVQKQRHARRRFERTHVAPVPAHDAPLHLGARHQHRGCRKLVHVSHRAALHGLRHDLRGDRLALLARGLLDATAEDRSVGAKLRVGA